MAGHQKFCYLEDKDGTAFLEASYADNTLQIRWGLVGKPCLVLRYEVSKETADRYASIVQEAMTGEGYAEASETAGIIDGSRAEILLSESIKDHPVYGRVFKIGNFKHYHSDGDYLVIHFPNGLEFDGDFDVGRISELRLFAGLIIEGDVSINGNFTQDEYEYPAAILILGNVTAENFVHADSHMVIKGNVAVEQTIFGYYNDGSLDISGDVSGEALIVDDHHLGISGAHHLFSYNNTSFDENDKDWINPKLIDLEGHPDMSLIADYVLAKKSILRKGVVYEPELLPEQSDEDQSPSDEGVQLDIPEDLVAALAPFSMADDNAGLTRTLVEWGERSEGWALIVEGRTHAPSCSAEERAALLAVLAEYRKTHPAPAVEPYDAAEARRIAVEEWRVPAGGHVLSARQAHPDILDLILMLRDDEDRANDWTKLEAHLSTLVKSEMLEAHAGYLFYKTMDGPPSPPALRLAECLLKLEYSPDVTIEGLDDWETYNAAEFAEDYEYTKLVDLFIKYFPELEREEPEEPASMSYEEVERLQKSAKKDIKQISKLNERASKRQQSEAAEALGLFTKAKDLATPYLAAPESVHDIVAFDYVHACQGRLWCLNDLIAGGDEALKPDAIAQATEILDTESQDFYYSVEGHAYRAATVLANNALGWYTYLDAKGLAETDEARQSGLERALEYIDAALPYAVDQGEGTLAAVLENKALILFELDRSDEAHLVVYQALKRLSVKPDYFAGIAGTDAYKDWDAAT